ncbi:MAG: hypothetical protein H0Z38_05890 [Firmicutes bacterium]|nr:hypothetical protein [Bacillota bacterium]
MMKREWMIKDVDSIPQEVSARVVRPDLVLVEGGLRQHLSYIDDQGVVRRHERTIPLSRQVQIPGALPGHVVNVDTEIKNTKPKTDWQKSGVTLVSLFITVEDERGIIGVKTEEFMLQDAPWPEPVTQRPSRLAEEPDETLQDETDLRRQLELEYARRLEEARASLERELCEAYQRDVQAQLALMRKDMEAELSRRWKQQLSSFQKRYGFRGSVEFGSA